LSESFGPPQKTHRPIMIGLNARLLSAAVSDDFGKSHFRLMYKSNDYHEFCFHNSLSGMANGS
jgi:hypothetical protein